MREIWLPVKGYEEFYEVSNLGNVKVTAVVRICPTKTMSMRGRLLKQSKHRQGYLCVGLSKDGVRKGWLVHRLVAMSFIENPHNLLEVNHKDAVKSNNCVSNLEWCSRLSNQHHAMKLGLAVNFKGEQHGSAILSEQQVLKIRELYKSNDATRIRKLTYQKLATMFGVGAPCIYHIINRKTWSHI